MEKHYETNEGLKHWREGKTNEGDAVQVNRAGLIKQIQDRCGGQIRLVRRTRKQEAKQNRTQTQKTHKTHVQ